MDLFDYGKASNKPLAERMRPETLDDFVGQEHILGADSLLRRAIKADKLGSCIFCGPPGVGKTTLAHIIATNTKGAFVKLNAVSSGVADAKKAIEEARDRLKMYGRRTYLLLDECHRWNKAQSDCVLSAIEDGSIVFIGSTTENPYVSMTRAIVSRCRIFEFKAITSEDLLKVLRRAVTDCDKGIGNMNVTLTPEAAGHFIFASAGDVRCALNALELAALTTMPDSDGKITVDLEAAVNSIQKKALSIDENMHYDMLSAFCKSIRGSDPDAAVYWAMRLIEGGCDPMVIARRLVVHCSEDIGLADSNAMVVAVSSMTALERIGYPEGRIPLTHAIIYAALAPKSNAVVGALGAALEDITLIKDDGVPVNLRDTNYSHPDGKAGGYLYPHYFGGYIEQQYLPDSLKDRVYYNPSQNGAEKDIEIKKRRR